VHQDSGDAQVMRRHLAIEHGLIGKIDAPINVDRERHNSWAIQTGGSGMNSTRVSFPCSRPSTAVV
jgi:hypothetical protein